MKIYDTKKEKEKRLNYNKKMILAFYKMIVNKEDLDYYNKLKKELKKYIIDKKQYEDIKNVL